MGGGKIYEHFYARFKSLNRNYRDNLLCALIRVNYGTPWSGDLKILHQFFPTWFHQHLSLNGLNDLIEALSTFADEPTDSGIKQDSFLDEHTQKTKPWFAEKTLLNLHAPIPKETVTIKILG